MALVVDASVAVKWFVEETDHAQARALLTRNIRRSAPDLNLVEIANALKNKARRKEIGQEQADQAVATLPNFFVELVHSAPLYMRAYQLASTLNHPVPDCMYLACAEHLGGAVISADKEFLAKASGAVAVGLLDLSDESLTVAFAADITITDSVFREISRLSSIVAATFAAVLPPADPDQPLSIRPRPVRDMRPAFDSPAYRALARRILEMTKDDVALLLALAWLGRDDYRPDQWDELLSNAEQFVAHGTEQNIQYIIAQMKNVELGREKLISSARITTQ